MAKKKETGSEEILDRDTEINIDLGDFENLAEESEVKTATKKVENLSDENDGEISDEAMTMSEDLPVKLMAVLGKKSVVLKDLLKMKVGQAIELDRAPNEFVDITANGKLIARGELVEIEGKLGVRIIKMLK